MASQMLEASVEEIALEGLDGLTLAGLWIRLSERQRVSFSPSSAEKEFIWNYLKYRPDIEIVELPEDRPLLVVPASTLPDGASTSAGHVYSYPVSVCTGGIFGSCSNISKRKDITDAVRDASHPVGQPFASLSDSAKWENRIAFVASLEHRVRALVGPSIIPSVFLTQNTNPLNYAVLERIGRSRHYGCVQAGGNQQSLTSVFNIKPRDLFYINGRFERQGLIEKQTMRIPTDPGNPFLGSMTNVFYLRRFLNTKLNEREAAFNFLVKTLARLPDKSASSSHVMKLLAAMGCRQRIGRILKVDRGRIIREKRMLSRVEYEEYCQRIRAMQKILLPRIARRQKEIDPDDDDEHNEKDGDAKSSGSESCESDSEKGDTVAALDSDTIGGILSTKSFDKHELEPSTSAEVTKLVLRREMYIVPFLRLAERKEQTEDDGCDEDDEIDGESAGTSLDSNGPYRTRIFGLMKAITDSGNKGLSTADVGHHMGVSTKIAGRTLYILKRQCSRFIKDAMVQRGKLKEFRFFHASLEHESRDVFDTFFKETGVQLDRKDKRLTGRHVQLLLYILQVLKETPVIDFIYNLIKAVQVIDAEKVTVDRRSLTKLVTMLEKLGLIHTYPRQLLPQLRAKFICAAHITEDSQELEKAIEDTMCRMDISRRLNQGSSRIDLRMQKSSRTDKEDSEAPVEDISSKDQCASKCRQSKGILDNTKKKKKSKSPKKDGGKVRGPLKKPEAIVEPNSENEESATFAKPVVPPKKAKISAEKKSNPDPVKNPPAVKPTKMATMTFEPTIATLYGLQSKGVKIQLLHEFLTYLLYHYRGNGPSFDERFECVSLRYSKLVKPLSDADREMDIQVTYYDCLENPPENPPVYLNEVSWRRFVPPLPRQKGIPDGWFMMHDLIMAMPLSIYLMIVAVYYKIDGLDEYLEDPVRRHILVADVKPEIRTALTYKRRHIQSLDWTFVNLAALGLVSIGCQLQLTAGIKNREGNFYYLHRRSSLLDTSTSPMRHLTVAEPDADTTYKRYNYVFSNQSSVALYWQHVRAVSISTQLGFRHCLKPDEKIILDEFRPLKGSDALLKRIGILPKSFLEVQEEGVPPGLRNGAAGYHPLLFLYRQCNWTANHSPNARWFLDVLRSRITKHEPHILLRVKNLSSIWNSYVKASLSSTLAGGRPKDPASKPPKTPFEDEFDDELPSLPKRKKLDSNYVTNPGQRKRTPDNVDREATQRRTNQRAHFSEREKDLLTLIRAVSVFLVPAQRLWFDPAVLRDIMHHLCPESRDKTTVSLMVASHRQVIRNKEFAVKLKQIVSQLGQNKEIASFRERNLIRPNTSDTRKSQIFRKTFDMAYRLLKRDTFEGTIPDSVEEFHAKYEATAAKSLDSGTGTDKAVTWKHSDVANEDEIKEAMLHNLVYASFALNRVDGSFSPEMYLVYRQFPENMLKTVMDDMRTAGFISYVRPYVLRRTAQMPHVEPQARSKSLCSKSDYFLSFYYRNFFYHKFHVQLSVESLELHNKLQSNPGQWQAALAELPGFVTVIASLMMSNELEFKIEVPQGFLKGSSEVELLDPVSTGEPQDADDAAAGGSVIPSETTEDANRPAGVPSGASKRSRVKFELTDMIDRAEDGNLSDDSTTAQDGTSDFDGPGGRKERDQSDSLSDSDAGISQSRMSSVSRIGSTASRSFRMSKVLSAGKSADPSLHIRDFHLAPIDIQVRLGRSHQQQTDVTDSSRVHPEPEFKVPPNLKNANDAGDDVVMAPEPPPTANERCQQEFNEWMSKISRQISEAKQERILSLLRQLHEAVLSAGGYGHSLQSLQASLSATAATNLVALCVDLLVKGKQIRRVGVKKWRYVAAYIDNDPWLVTSHVRDKSQPELDESAIQSASEPVDDVSEEGPLPSDAAETNTDLDAHDEIPSTSQGYDATHFAEDGEESMQTPLDRVLEEFRSAKKIQFSPRPWLRPDGTINRRMLRWLCEGVFLHIAANPGQLEEAITDHFNPAVQPCATVEIMEYLERISCLQRRTLKIVQPESLSPFVTSKRIVKDVIFWEPTPTCFVTLSKAFEGIPMPDFITRSLYGPSGNDGKRLVPVSPEFLGHNNRCFNAQKYLSPLIPECQSETLDDRSAPVN